MGQQINSVSSLEVGLSQRFGGARTGETCPVSTWDHVSVTIISQSSD